jgi:hypothetical protein
MEQRLHQGVETAADNLLGDAVGDRGNPQRPRPAVRLRDVHPAHRRRHVAARRQPLPELVEVVGEPHLEVLDRLPIHSSRSLVGLAFTCLKASQTSRFGMSNGFASVMRLLPSPVGRPPGLNTTAPSVRRHYSAFTPTTSCSAPVLRIGTLILMVSAIWMSPFASERQVLTFPTKA